MYHNRYCHKKFRTFVPSKGNKGSAQAEAEWRHREFN